MNAHMKIVKKIKEVYGAIPGPVTVYKGFDWGNGGWHYRTFGKSSIYLGSNATKALETLEQIAGEREQAASDYEDRGY